MAKSQDSKKATKKAPAKDLMQKRKEKKSKKRRQIARLGGNLPPIFFTVL